MGFQRFSSRIWMIVWLSAALLAFARNLSAASPPDYTRLSPLTSHLSAPTAVALDAQENLYVTEASKNRLHRFDPQGGHTDTLEGLTRPISVAVDAGGRVYVGNAGGGNVEVYGPDLQPLMKLGEGDGEFGQPSDIAVDGSGTAYVVDSRRNSIRIYRPDGSFRNSIGAPEAGEPLFQFPSSIALDEYRGELIVTDLKGGAGTVGRYGGARIQVFSIEGELLREFSDLGEGAPLLVKPLGVETDPEGRIYVTDAFRNVVQVLDRDGGHLTTIHDEGHPLRTPLGIAYAPPSGRLFIASLSRRRVEIFSILSPPGYSTLTVNISGEGSGVVKSLPPGIECGEECAADLPAAGPVTLTAEAHAGSVFAWWSGDCSGCGPCEVWMDGDRSVTAHFSAAPARGGVPRDFNGDGLSDLLGWDPLTGAVYVWLVGETPAATMTLAGAAGPALSVSGAADFDGDGRADIVLRDTGSGGVLFWFMDGANIVAVADVGRQSPRRRVVAVTDFDGDGRADILWRHDRSGALSLWLMDGAGIVSRPQIRPAVKRDWEVAAVTDFDGDGGADILWRHDGSGALVIWLMDGATVRSRGTVADSSDGEWRVIGGEDFNGDGKGDILWRSLVSGELCLWLLDSLTVRSVSAAGGIPDLDWTAGAGGDFDGDGIADLAGWHGVSEEAALWLTAGGRIGETAGLGAADRQIFLW
jgi:DNA-binding beta-propeller fold protein YncE